MQVNNTQKSMFSFVIKTLKASLPKECSFIAPVRKGQDHYVKVIIKGQEHNFSVPSNLSFTDADINELKTLIISKI